MNDTKSVIGMIVSPKQTILSLPENEIIQSTIAVGIGMWIVPLIQSIFILKELSFDFVLFLQALLLTITAILITPLITLILLNIFKKRATLFQLINIFCSSQIPRLFFIILITMLYLAFPSLGTVKQFNQVSNFIALVLTGYSFILFIYGAIIATPKKKTNLTSRLSGL